MEQIKNTTGSKVVNIRTDAWGNIVAVYAQIYKGYEQVLHGKVFKNYANAVKWANKKIK